MAENDLDNQVTSEDEGLGSEKLVPVSESIRYRKRAQNAEKRISSLEQQLDEALEQNKQLTEQLSGKELEQELIRKLTTAGAGDLETAVLLAKTRLRESGDAEVDSVIEQLRKDKGFLFSDIRSGAASKTAGVKAESPSGQRGLERAAKKAAASGNRVDLQEYLKVRRQFV
jgi:hypothetical protein